MTNIPFRGTGIALITPFKIDGEIDWNALEKLIHFNIDNGVNYLVSLGTTGESVTLSIEEKKRVWEFTSKIVNGKIPLVAGIGGNNTAQLINTFKEFDIIGYDAILTFTLYIIICRGEDTAIFM